MKKALLGIALFGWAVSGANPALAYPDRPVRLIVPFAAGGVTDLAGRLMGQALSTKWGQPVVVENRPGGGGLIGVDQVVKAEPDGYTILMGTNGEFVMHPAASAKPRFNALTDLTPITMVTSTAYVWAANVKSGINSLQDLIAQAKAKPDHVTYASAGVGTNLHMVSEQFAAAANVKMLHVPYKGGSPATTAILAGEVAVGMVALSQAEQVKDAARTRLLAVTGAQRTKMLPDIPTVEETGVVKDYRAAVWTALMAPKGTPEAIVSKIQADALEVMKDPALIERLSLIGTDVAPVSGDDLRARIQTEIGQMRTVAKAADIVLP